MDSVLSVKDLSVKFDDLTVIQDLSFDLLRGESLAIIGPNGSGKTVLLRSLLNIIPHSGEIRWAEGVRIGYVPQKIDADRHLPLTMKNLLESKAKILNFSPNRVKESSDKVHLTPVILNTPVGHLSGGQFQKALIAFAFLGDPNVILLDEPTASLDQLSQEHVYELIDELRRKYGLTVILVSHELSVVNEYATLVLCLNKEKVCFGTPKEALTPEVLQKLYSSHKHHHHEHE